MGKFSSTPTFSSKYFHPNFNENINIFIKTSRHRKFSSKPTAIAVGFDEHIYLKLIILLHVEYRI